MPVIANMKQLINVTANLVVTSNQLSCKKYYYNKVCRNSCYNEAGHNSCNDEAGLTAVTTKLVVTAFTTKLVVSAYFKESCQPAWTDRFNAKIFFNN